MRPLLATAALAGALLTSPPASAQVLSEGHADFAARIVDGRLVSAVKHGTSWHDPSSVTFVAGDAARTTIPASATFLGRAGDPIWILPEVQRAGLLWPGWNTEEVTSAHVEGPVAWSLDAISGPGDFTLFQPGVFGEPDILFRSADGLPDTRPVPLGTHAHGNWAFSREGAYRLTFTLRAKLRGGETATDTRTLAVAVGAAPAPAPAPTAAPPATPTPGPSPLPGPAPDAQRPATAPALRPLSARVDGRTLRLLVRTDRRSRVTVTLRRGPRVSARTKARIVAAGTRTLQLRLDRRPAAGRHSVRITATTEGRSRTRTIAVRVRPKTS